MRNELILLSSGGSTSLPTHLRRGLVAHYDPWRQYITTGPSQMLLDYSGHRNHGTLGATDGVGADDPAWTGKSLLFDGVDDYVDCGDTDKGNITLVAVSNVNESAGWHTLCARHNCMLRIIHQYEIGFERLLTFYYNETSDKSYSQRNNNATTSPIMTKLRLTSDGHYSIDGLGVTPLKTSGNSLYDANVIGSKLGGYGNTTVSSTLNGNIYLLLRWDRVLSDAELIIAEQRVVAYMASRGILI